jgi:hypothetical protein
MKTISLASLFALTACAQDFQIIRHVTGNYSYDLVGTPDNRPCNAGYDDPASGPCFWGTHEAQVSTLYFDPPPTGKRIRILDITGDLVAWWTTRGRGPAWPGNGYHTGILVSVMTLPESQGSIYAFPAADDHLGYVQAVIGNNGATQKDFKFKYDPRDANSVLQSTEPCMRGEGAFCQALYFKAAKYLDTSGLDTHIETTWEVKFMYEDQ